VRARHGGVWQVVRNLPLPVSEFNGLQPVAWGGGAANSVAFLGLNAVAWMPLAGDTWDFVSLDGYETPIKDGYLNDVTSGDLDNDGRKDLVFMETAKNHLDLVIFDANHKLVPADRWQCSSKKPFAGEVAKPRTARSRGGRPDRRRQERSRGRGSRPHPALPAGVVSIYAKHDPLQSVPPPGRPIPSLERTLPARGGNGFDWVYINPIQKTGASRSLYSIADYFQLNEALLDTSGTATPDEQCRAMTLSGRAAGLKLMTDLVINHCAYDAPLTGNTRTGSNGSRTAASPGLLPARHRTRGVDDLAQFDHEHTNDKEGLFRYC